MLWGINAFNTIIRFSLILLLLYQIYDTYCLLTTSKTVCPQRRVQSFICYKMDKYVFLIMKELVLAKVTLNNISYQSKVVFQWHMDVS